MKKMTADQAWKTFNDLSLEEQETIYQLILDFQSHGHREMEDKEFGQIIALIPALKRKLEERRLGDQLAEFLPGGRLSH